MTERYLPQPENLIDAISYIKAGTLREAYAARFKLAFQLRDRTITDADVMEHADVRLTWRQRTGEPDAIQIVVEFSRYRHTVLVEASSFVLPQPLEA